MGADKSGNSKLSTPNQIISAISLIFLLNCVANDSAIAKRETLWHRGRRLWADCSGCSDDSAPWKPSGKGSFIPLGPVASRNIRDTSWHRLDSYRDKDRCRARNGCGGSLRSLVDTSTFRISACDLGRIRLVQTRCPSATKRSKCFS